MIKIEWKSCLKLGVTALAVFLCIYYWKAGTGFVLAVVRALASLIAGGVIAYIVNILMSFLERHYFQKLKKKLAGKSRRPVCMVTVYLLVIALLVLVVALVVPELVQCIKILIDRLPEALEELSENETVAQHLPVVTEKLAEVDWDDMIAQVQEFVKANAGGVAGNIASSVSTVFSSIVTFVIGIIFSIYLLLGKEKLGAQCTALMTRYLKPGIKAKIQYVLAILNRNFHKYIVGQCTEALMIGVLTGIPVVGGLIGGVIGALMMLTVSPMKAFRELTALEKARTSGARAAALLMGLFGTALLAGGFYAVFAAHVMVMIVLILAGIALCVLSALIYPAIVKRQEKMLAPYIAKLHAEATRIYLIRAKDGYKP